MSLELEPEYRKLLSERIVMALAEAGVSAFVAQNREGDWVYVLFDESRRNKALARRAAALARLSIGSPVTYCIDHAYLADPNPCAGVDCIVLTRDPEARCVNA